MAPFVWYLMVLLIYTLKLTCFVSGTKFLCSQLIAPIRSEPGEVCMYILNFEDLTEAPFRGEEIIDETVPVRNHKLSK